MTKEQAIGLAMRQCRNFFERGSRTGEFTISNGVLAPAPNSPYVYISGSARNDGVHAVDFVTYNQQDTMTDETFEGTVWFLYPPADFLILVDRIVDYDSKAQISPVMSESFGQYSYTKAQSKNGGQLTWQEAFVSDLIPFRKMFTEVG